MFKWLEKWALQKFLKRAAENVPVAQNRLPEIWKENKEEIFEEVIKVIESTIIKILTKDLDKSHHN